MQKNKKIILLVIFILIFASYVGLKKSRFHVDGISLVKGGSITLSPIEVTTKIFLDNKKVSMEDLENVRPGLHTIILAEDSLWPWKKDVVVVSNEASELFPFLVSKSVSGEIITQSDGDYGRLRTLILNEQLPTTASPILSGSSLVEVWSDQNNIFARWNGGDDVIPAFFCNNDGDCSSLVNVIESESEVRNIDFFKGRDDVLLIASQNGVFVIEIDKRGSTQNFQPVYKGTASPRFSVDSESSIYVLDGALLFLVSI